MQRGMTDALPDALPLRQAKLDAVILPRNEVLVWACSTYGVFDGSSDLPRAPTITCALTYKWYALYIVHPSGSVSELNYGDIDREADYTHGSAYVDHTPNPKQVRLYADRHGYAVDTVAFELMTGRWQHDVVEDAAPSPAAPPPTGRLIPGRDGAPDIVTGPDAHIAGIPVEYKTVRTGRFRSKPGSANPARAATVNKQAAVAADQHRMVAAAAARRAVIEARLQGLEASVSEELDAGVEFPTGTIVYVEGGDQERYLVCRSWPYDNDGRMYDLINCGEPQASIDPIRHAKGRQLRRSADQRVTFTGHTAAARQALALELCSKA